MSEIKQRNELYDEWDASLECGSGVICVSGPRGCGKTHSLLQYLLLREQALLSKNLYLYSSCSEQERINQNDTQHIHCERNVNSTSSNNNGNTICKENIATKSSPQEKAIILDASAKVKYNNRQTAYKIVLVSAKCALTPHEALVRFTETLERSYIEYYDELRNNSGDAECKERQIPQEELWRRKRPLHHRRSVNALLFGECVRSWWLLHANSDSELHCILDDADAFHDESIEQELGLWWEGCQEAMSAPYATKRTRVEQSRLERAQQETTVLASQEEEEEKKKKKTTEKRLQELEERREGCKSASTPCERNCCKDNIMWKKKQQVTKFILWVVSQLPLRINGCFRYHILRTPSPSCIISWLTNHFRQKHIMEQNVNCDDDSLEAQTSENYEACSEHSKHNCRECSNGNQHRFNSSNITNRTEEAENSKSWNDANCIEHCALEAIQYYITHQPMRSSIITHDIRSLLHRVYALLPLLMKEVLLQKHQLQSSKVECDNIVSHRNQYAQTEKYEQHKYYHKEQEETSATMLKEVECTNRELNITVKLNALHFAKAWSQYVTTIQNNSRSSLTKAFVESTSTAKQAWSKSNSNDNKEVHIHQLNKNIDSEIEPSTNVHVTKETMSEVESENYRTYHALEYVERPQVNDSIVQSLSDLGYSAVLLAFTSFYCGAVPRSKISDVLGTFVDSRTHGQGRRRRRSTLSANTSRKSVAARVRSEATTQSHKASVLTSSAQTISCEWLLNVYDSLLQIVTQRIDPLEFVCASVAVHVIDTFVKWGLLVHLVHGRVVSPSTHLSPLSSESSFRCFIPVSTALLLGEMLSVNLYELIPS